MNDLNRDPAAAASDTTLKALIIGRRKAVTTVAEHRHHIRHVHGELVLRYIAAEPANAPRRYVHNPVIDAQWRDNGAMADALALGADFVTQVWFPDVEALQRSRATPYFKAHVEPDERNFADPRSVGFLAARERQLVGVAPAHGGSWKLFHLVQRSATGDPSAFGAAWARAAQRLRDLPGGAAVRGHVQNDILNRPGAPVLADGIDEFWLDDEASARALLPAWQAHLREELVKPGWAQENSLVGLLGREDILYAGTSSGADTPMSKGNS